MPFLMITAAVSILVVMVVTVCSCGDQLTLQISFHRLVCITLSARAQLYASLCKSRLSSAADASADQHIH